MRTNTPNLFDGRTVQVVRDLSADEQFYLYQQTRRLKEAITAGDSVSRYRIADDQLGVYLLFLEDSTRTKESFRNAAKFHGLKVNDFNVVNSSFQKKENLTDTVKMLTGYSSRSLFVVRSKTEGVCRWLDSSMKAYADKIGLAPPVFINAGDGRHEHPTQEFLDEFSFLEKRNWDRSSIHLALVGDLFHGRTVHSKVDGLGVFGEIRVDLIAPPEITMPEHYIEGMRKRGYLVRSFESIEEYLSRNRDDIADIWYFTRLQLERMGEKLQNRAVHLRRSVSFQREWMGRLPENTRFFHPLPRHSETPTIPMFLDDTPLNGWDMQSRNGYLIRIVLMSMLAGRIGDDFSGETIVLPDYSGSFMEPAEIRHTEKREYKIGIRPVEHGVVIDHIGRGKDPSSIWEHITTIRRLLNLNTVASHGVFLSERDNTYKGIISIPGKDSFPDSDLRTLAAVAPGCTLNLIRDAKVKEKFRLSTPPRVTNLSGLKCKNPDCISNPDYHEPAYPDFFRSEMGRFVCRYCETPHSFNEIWGQDWSTVS